MLADCLAFAPKLKHVEDLLVQVYGPNWLSALEKAALRRQKRARGTVVCHSRASERGVTHLDSVFGHRTGRHERLLLLPVECGSP